MSILLSDNVEIDAPKPSDPRFGPWASVAAAVAGIPATRRYVGLTVGVLSASGETQQYHFKSSTANAGLVPLGGTVAGVFRGKYAANTAYGAYDGVINPAGVRVYAPLAFTSGAAYAAINWAPNVPIATATVLGLVKQGTGLFIGGDGTISVDITPPRVVVIDGNGIYTKYSSLLDAVNNAYSGDVIELKSSFLDSETHGVNFGECTVNCNGFRLESYSGVLMTFYLTRFFNGNIFGGYPTDTTQFTRCKIEQIDIPAGSQVEVFDGEIYFAPSPIGGTLIINGNALVNGTPTFTGAGIILDLRTATATNLGRIKVGAGLDVAPDGTLRATGPTGQQLESIRTLLVASAAQTGSYTLSITDAGNLVPINSASAAVVNIPANAAVNFPIGTIINVSQEGGGQVTISGAAGVSITGFSGLKIPGQYGEIGLRKMGANTWRVTGGVA